MDRGAGKLEGRGKGEDGGRTGVQGGKRDRSLGWGEDEAARNRRSNGLEEGGNRVVGGDALVGEDEAAREPTIERVGGGGTELSEGMRKESVV